ncbi:hypothetical protein BC835DRAFT_649426 [Cytidiella melzeri]|nr:hypothetical protein BC835DRAFT_649426 [Cytidiella melzeri]
MHRGRIDAIVHVLAGYPPDEIRAFFDDLRIRRPNWKGHLQPELNGCPSEKEILLEDDILEKSYTMLTDVVCELRDVLDMDQALLILQIEPRLTPLAILFHRPPRSRKNSLNFQLLFAFLAHLDYNPTYCGTQHRLGFDFQWVVKTAVEILCKHPTDDLLRVVAHILRAVQPLAWPDPLELEIAQLRVIFPWVEPWSPRRYLARHPASPFLSFAIFLADRSKEAAKLLVEGGLVRTLEAMYDQDFPDPRVRDDDPYVQTREEMYKLCLRLLTAVHRHCNLRDCVLMEELKSDVRRCSRELSEQYFGVFWSD